VKNLRIYALVDKARQALEHGEIAAAREHYNKVRELFNKEKLSPQEKSVLYTTIRELYDDIHLASLA
jgi:site-specific DNA-adenine methylase